MFELELEGGLNLDLMTYSTSIKIDRRDMELSEARTGFNIAI